MRWWIKPSVFLAAWTAVGLLFSVQIYVDHVYADSPISWPQALFLALSEWYVWAALSPAIAALARRFPIGRSTWLTSLAVLAASPASILVFSTLALFASLASAGTLALLPRIWRGGGWTRWRKTRFTVTTIIFAACAALLLSWGALQPWNL